jgi:hypothetical protein
MAAAHHVDLGVHALDWQGDKLLVGCDQNTVQLFQTPQDVGDLTALGYYALPANDVCLD